MINVHVDIKNIKITDTTLYNLVSIVWNRNDWETTQQHLIDLKELMFGVEPCGKKENNQRRHKPFNSISDILSETAGELWCEKINK